ncbi:MAG: hypothetical protein GY863_10900 [bacterium]|nr:hypothetical protein [bacterium]
MSVDHLTENEMQEYLEGASGDKQPEIEDHLKQCEACRVQITAYRHIFKGFNGEPENIFSDDLEEIVLEKIRTTDPVKSTVKNPLFYLLPAGIGLGMIVAFIIRKNIFSVLTEQYNYITREVLLSITALSDILNSNDLRIEYLVIFLVFFLIYSTLDRVFFSTEYKNENGKPTADLQ